MPAYVIARVRVTDPEQYAHYRAATPAAVAEFGGRFIVRGGAMETLEGSEETSRIVVIEFDSMEKARAFYHSGTYQAAIRLRENAAEAQLVLVEGAGG